MIQEIIQSGGILHFTAAWCGPCKTLSRTFDSNKSEFKKIKRFKVDLDEHQELCEKYNVRSVPTLLLFRNGKEIKRLVGARSLQELIDFIN